MWCLTWTVHANRKSQKNGSYLVLLPQRIVGNVFCPASLWSAIVFLALFLCTVQHHILACLCRVRLTVSLLKVLGFWDCSSVFWWGPVSRPGPVWGGNPCQRDAATPGPREEDEMCTRREREHHIYSHHSGNSAWLWKIKSVNQKTFHPVDEINIKQIFICCSQLVSFVNTLKLDFPH